MTQEQKELLLKDLCGRLPYGVKADVINEDNEHRIVKIGEGNIGHLGKGFWKECKPYLFPISSMSEEQHKEYRKACDLDMTILENRPMKGEPFPAMYNSQDWLDAHHFDYRGLIPMGLAKDATGLCIY